METNKVYFGDNINIFKNIEDNSIDSIVTDPPYGISFMAKKWDQMSIMEFYDFNVKWLTESFRVLKPGGHILSFGHSRTSHRLACAVEDVGFELRDSIIWLYSTGMPKSLNVGKSIQKLQGVELEDTGIIHPASRPNTKSDLYNTGKHGKNFTIKNVTTTEAKKYDGWGTSLKPMHETITIGRKPLSEKSIADNILKHGTGGINIDKCRIPINKEIDKTQDRVINRNVNSSNKEKGWGFNNETKQSEVSVLDMDKGRFPGNVIIDDGVALELRNKYGVTKSGKITTEKESYDGDSSTKFIRGITTMENQHGDSGGVDRFFYCAKPSIKEKNLGMGNEKNNHVSVKPIALIRYLVRMVTPDGGVCLDPFIGSGTTGCACLEENIKFIGIEQDEHYFDIANKRINAFVKEDNEFFT